MDITKQIAKLLRDVYFGGNWTASNLKDNVANVTWQQAITKAYSLNTIAALVYHMDYYVCAVHKVLQGGPLDAKDKYSFDLPSIQSQEDWEELLNKIWADANNLADAVEQMPESKLWEDFAGGKYGTYYRNIHGVIEHCHYHLGQIAIIKKIIAGENRLGQQ
ncbi:MAG: DUF1572 domain-containing protein [Bacteroidetes bacterium]|nr:DUF1572 domain-containing protein [Bacteroidota bacterium]